MRKVLLTMALVGLLVIPVLAQFRGGGFGGGQTGDALLFNKSVQEELKLTDAQKKSLGEVTKAGADLREKGKEAFQDGDKEKGQEFFKKAGEETTKALKKFKDGLTTIQTKRFDQIQIQVATKNNDANLFKREDIVKALKLSDKQKETVKETLSELAKDTKEVLDDAKDDFRTKGKAAFTKIGTLRKEAYEKITKTFEPDQTKAFKDMAGDKFELKMEKGKFGKGGKGGKKDKKDDF